MFWVLHHVILPSYCMKDEGCTTFPLYSSFPMGNREDGACWRATCELKANGCGEYTLQSSSNGWNTVDFVVTEKVLLNIIISDMLLCLSRGAV